jgi:hypothetical protein
MKSKLPAHFSALTILLNKSQFEDIIAKYGMTIDGVTLKRALIHALIESDAILDQAVETFSRRQQE